MTRFKSGGLYMIAFGDHLFSLLSFAIIALGFEVSASLLAQ
jgi:hypothetical protein